MFFFNFQMHCYMTLLIIVLTGYTLNCMRLSVKCIPRRQVNISKLYPDINEEKIQIYCEHSVINGRFTLAVFLK